MRLAQCMDAGRRARHGGGLIGESCDDGVASEFSSPAQYDALCRYGRQAKNIDPSHRELRSTQLLAATTTRKVRASSVSIGDGDVQRQYSSLAKCP
jgi:hypothetical protein